MSIDPDGSLHLAIAADLPGADGGPPTHVSCTRTVSAADLSTGGEFQYVFSSGGQEEYPGATTLGPSAAVFSDLVSKGEASIKLNGEVGGLADLMGVAAQMMQGKKPEGYLTAEGVLKLAEPKPVPVTVLVNSAAVALSAWHAKGQFGEEAAEVDWIILDDARNPLSLRSTFGKGHSETVKIDFPVENEAQAMETDLAKMKRSVLYGVYFDFNSSELKPQSDRVLKTIVEVMKKNPGWTLVVEGHTDNIGGDSKNQQLSARLQTTGYGRAVPKATNDTIAGRARNRRVELSRP